MPSSQGTLAASIIAIIIGIVAIILGIVALVKRGEPGPRGPPGPPGPAGPSNGGQEDVIVVPNSKTVNGVGISCDFVCSADPNGNVKKQRPNWKGARCIKATPTGGTIFDNMIWPCSARFPTGVSEMNCYCTEEKDLKFRNSTASAFAADWSIM